MAVDVENQTLRKIAELVRSSVSADRVTIYELDPVQKEVNARVGLGLELGQEIRLPLTRGVIGFVARTGRSLRLRDAYNDPRFDPSIDQRTGYRTRTMICVPVLDRTQAVRGAIQAINKLEGPFTEDDEQRILAFCEEVAVILNRSRSAASPGS
jgi:GAF domain-containing protein